MKTELEELCKETLLATQVTNILLLAQAMNVDVTEPIGRAKVLRHMTGVTSHVESSEYNE